MMWTTQSALPTDYTIITLVSIFAFFGFHCGIKLYKRTCHKKEYHRKIKTKQEMRLLNFQAMKNRTHGISHSSITEITRAPFAVLQKNLQTKCWSAGQVLLAYQAAALESQQICNCVAEFILQANEMADKLDMDGPTDKLPLFGVPFSMKDNFDVSGYDSTGGLVRNALKPKLETSNIIKHLTSLGAVPFVKSNVPQGLIGIVCNNPIFGKTVNPVDNTRLLGGASSADAALLVTHGSVFAVGSDIGGSLRMPAHSTGISAIKPSSCRRTTAELSRSSARRGV